MSIQATNTFQTRPGRAAELIAMLQRVLPDTLTHGGCEEIRLWRDQDDENKVVSATRWTTRGAYEEYLEWRHGRGDTAMFREMLIKDMEVSYYDEVLALVDFVDSRAIDAPVRLAWTFVSRSSRRPSISDRGTAAVGLACRRCTRRCTRTRRTPVRSGLRGHPAPVARAARGA